MSDSSGFNFGEDDLDEFLDANTFSFGSDALEMALDDLDDAPTTRGVQFNPMVSVCGGGQIPLAAGDGFWDTLQYLPREAFNTMGGRRDSLSSHELDETEGSMSESKLFNSSGSMPESPGSGSLSLGDLASPKEEEIGIMEVFSEGVYTKGQQLLDYMSKVLKGDSDDELRLDEDDSAQPQDEDLQESLTEEEGNDSKSKRLTAFVPNMASNPAGATSTTNNALTLK